MENHKVPTSAEHAEIERRAVTHQRRVTKEPSTFSPLFVLATIGVFGAMGIFLLFLYG